MGLETRRDRFGQLIRQWYGRFLLDGRRCTRNLNVAIKGKPPASWIPENKVWPLSDLGDEAFEASRQEALAALKTSQSQTKEIRAMDVNFAVERVTRARGFRKWKNTQMLNLMAAYETIVTKAIDRTRERNPQYAKWKRNHVRAFMDWWRDSGRGMHACITAITVEDAQAYINFLSSPDESGNVLTTETIRRIKAHLSSFIDRLLPPDGLRNPFRAFNVESLKGERTIHRQPLSREEADELIRTARRIDPLAHELIVTGLSTALRRGDVCRLSWDSVNLKANSVRVVTSKTDVEVEIPIFPAFRDILEKRLQDKPKDSPYVFPEAEELVRLHPDVLTRRIKTVFATAFAEQHGVNVEEASTSDKVNLKDVLPDVLQAVSDSDLFTPKRERLAKMLEIYAEHPSYREVAKQLGCPLSSVSYNLRDAERVSGIRFLNDRNTSRNGISNAIKKVTQQKRRIGRHAASIYDFHALRTTFVTLAAINGIPLDTVRLITGHTNTAVLQKYYDRAKGTDVAEVLGRAMPAALTISAVDKAIPVNAPGAVAVPTPVLSRAGLKKLAAMMTPAQRKQLIKELVNAED